MAEPIRRLAWLTDIHLEFLDAGRQLDDFCRSVAEAAPDAVLIGGDTATAPLLEARLLRLEQCWQRPIYFVLGNHDFYGGSIAEVRSLASLLTQTSRWLRWLPAFGVVELTPDTALVGHDGWADGRLGRGALSPVLLNDYIHIQELAWLGQKARFDQLNALGDEAAGYVREVLPQAVERFRNVLFLTHPPPFQDACWHQGRISDPDFLPHFTCRAVGDALMEIMRAHPDCRLTVLCGHTHGQGEVAILPNLLVKTGGAEYGSPRLQDLITAS